MFSRYLLFYTFLCVLNCHIIKTSPLTTAYSLFFLESSCFFVKSYKVPKLSRNLLFPKTYGQCPSLATAVFAVSAHSQ